MNILEINSDNTIKIVLGEKRGQIFIYSDSNQDCIESFKKCFNITDEQIIYKFSHRGLNDFTATIKINEDAIANIINTMKVLIEKVPGDDPLLGKSIQYFIDKISSSSPVPISITGNWESDSFGFSLVSDDLMLKDIPEPIPEFFNEKKSSKKSGRNRYKRNFYYE
jgi:hypothetical protein